MRRSARGVPMLIASARVSARSARLLPAPAGSAARRRWPAASGSARRPTPMRSASRALGVPPARLARGAATSSSIAALPPRAARARQLRCARATPARVPLWVAGSTHAGEEQIVLEAHRRLLEQQPRRAADPGAAPSAALRCRGGSGRGARPGAACAVRPRRARDDCAVLLLDTLGELADFYAAADVAFVGGSLVPVGGHNLLEPAALGVPVLSGPQQFNSPELARALSERGALTIVHDAAELAGGARAAAGRSGGARAAGRRRPRGDRRQPRRARAPAGADRSTCRRSVGGLSARLRRLPTAAARAGGAARMAPGGRRAFQRQRGRGRRCVRARRHGRQRRPRLDQPAVDQLDRCCDPDCRPPGAARRCRSGSRTWPARSWCRPAAARRAWSAHRPRSWCRRRSRPGRLQRNRGRIRPPACSACTCAIWLITPW